MAKDSQQERNKAVIEKLRAHLANGNLLHGSKVLTDTIIPQQAHDDDTKRVTGNAHAVYGEAQDIRIPILMALFAEHDPSLKSYRTEYHTKGLDFPVHVTGENYMFTPGYIYVLPPGSFRREGSDEDFEYISKIPVHPTEIIEIDPTILSEFSDIYISHPESTTTSG